MFYYLAVQITVGSLPYIFFFEKFLVLLITTFFQSLPTPAIPLKF